MDTSSLGRAISAILGEQLSSDLRRYYQAHQLKRGRYDQSEPETQHLAQWVPRDGVALDIGANIGVYTRLLSQLVGPQGSVHAFEAIPGTYNTLTYNVSRFEHNNVVTYHAAVTERCGVAQMVLPRQGLSSMYRAHLQHDAEGTGRAIQVQALALDSLADALPRVDFVKCDVEGAEMLVLRGARQLLTQRRPKLMIEIQDDCRSFGYEPQDVFDWLTEAGWEPHFVREGKLTACRGLTDDNPGPNYVFTPL